MPTMYEVDEVYVGNDPVDAVYVGDVEVWPAGTPAGQPVFDTFAGLNGALPATTRTGQAWGLFSGPGSITNGFYDSEPGSGASYPELNSGKANITKIGCSWKFDTKGGTLNGNGCTMAIVTWADGGIVAGGFGRRTSCHVTITPNAVQWYVRDTENGGNVTLLSTQTISPALPKDTLIWAEARMDFDAGTGVVEFYDGRTFSWSDPRITSYPDEVWACWEPFYNNDGTDSRVGLHRVWADGDDLPPEPIEPFVVTSTYYKSNDNATSRSITIPTVNDGDLIILTSAALANSLTVTQTAGPTFTTLGNNMRTGITTTVLTRTAAAADSGSVVTMGYSGNVPGHLGILVLRNVAGLGTPQTRNQGSGSTTITMAPYTPSTTTLALHIVMLGNSALNQIPNLTPASGITVVSADLQESTGARTSIVYGINWTPNSAVGTTWANTNTHYAATWTIPINL